MERGGDVNCKDVNELLNEYIDNELSPGETAEVKEHLDGCDACKKELEELAGLHNNLKFALKTAAGEVTPPVNSLAIIKERAGIKSLPVKNGFWSRKSAGVAFSCIVVVMTLVSFLPFVFSATAPPPDAPILVSDGEGGVMLYWRTVNFKYEQYIDADGKLLWGENGRDITGGTPSFDISSTQDHPQTRYDYYSVTLGGNGNYIEVRYSEGVLNVYCTQWESGNILAYKNPHFNTLGYSNVISDGNGGVLIVSRAGEDSSLSNTHSIYAQHIDSEGNLLWGESGLQIQKVSSSPVVLIIAGIAIIIAGLVIFGLYRGNKVARGFVPIGSLVLFFTGLFCLFLMTTTIGTNVFRWDYVLDTPLNRIAIWAIILAGLALAVFGVKKAKLNKWVTIPVFIPYVLWVVVAVFWGHWSILGAIGIS